MASSWNIKTYFLQLSQYRQLTTPILSLFCHTLIFSVRYISIKVATKAKTHKLAGKQPSRNEEGRTGRGGGGSDNAHLKGCMPYQVGANYNTSVLLCGLVRVAKFSAYYETSS